MALYTELWFAIWNPASVGFDDATLVDSVGELWAANIDRLDRHCLLLMCEFLYHTKCTFHSTGRQVKCPDKWNCSFKPSCFVVAFSTKDYLNPTMTHWGKKPQTSNYCVTHVAASVDRHSQHPVRSLVSEGDVWRSESSDYCNLWGADDARWQGSSCDVMNIIIIITEFI